MLVVRRNIWSCDLRIAPNESISTRINLFKRLLLILSLIFHQVNEGEIWVEMSVCSVG